MSNPPGTLERTQCRTVTCKQDLHVENLPQECAGAALPLNRDLIIRCPPNSDIDFSSDGDGDEGSTTFLEEFGRLQPLGFESSETHKLLFYPTSNGIICPLDFPNA